MIPQPAQLLPPVLLDTGRWFTYSVPQKVHIGVTAGASSWASTHIRAVTTGGLKIEHR
ncbi:hypothetical protein [Actinophytocola xanthii]|uniref:hypothetical protein n=1 Tax=Actinophytocola xanthii TaxID=1912961 RepID=UPI0013018CDB|nr:hypothetical protein [Actinophytocola xanthii]